MDGVENCLANFLTKTYLSLVNKWLLVVVIEKKWKEVRKKRENKMIKISHIFLQFFHFFISPRQSLEDKKVQMSAMNVMWQAMLVLFFTLVSFSCHSSVMETTVELKQQKNEKKKMLHEKFLRHYIDNKKNFTFVNTKHKQAKNSIKLRRRDETRERRFVKEENGKNGKTRFVIKSHWRKNFRSCSDMIFKYLWNQWINKIEL